MHDVGVTQQINVILQVKLRELVSDHFERASGGHDELVRAIASN